MTQPECFFVLRDDQPEQSSLLQPTALPNTPSTTSARAIPDFQRLRAFRHYVRLLDAGNWGANYLLFYRDHAEATRAKVVIVDDGFQLQLHWLWRETGNATTSTSGTPSSMRRGHLACLEEQLPPGAVLSSVIFLGWYREVTFEEVVPQDAPPDIESARRVFSMFGRFSVDRNLKGVTVCVRHEPPFWELAPRNTQLGGVLDSCDWTATFDNHPYWVELPVLTPGNGSSILQSALNWVSIHPHLPSKILELLLSAVRNKLANKPGATLELLHVSDDGSLLPPLLDQRLEVGLLARVEALDKLRVKRLVVDLSVKELLFGGRGRTASVVGDIPIAIELIASPTVPSVEGVGRRVLPFSLEVTVHVAFVTSTTQRVSMLGEFLIDNDRVALSNVTQRGGATMQSFYRCSDPMHAPAVECAIVSIGTAID